MNLEEQPAGWIQFLQEHNFTFEHRQGRKHNNTDALSRRPCRQVCPQSQKTEPQADVNQVWATASVAADGWNPAALRTEQLNDRDMGLILEEAETGRCPGWKYIADSSHT